MSKLKGLNIGIIKKNDMNRSVRIGRWGSNGLIITGADASRGLHRTYNHLKLSRDVTPRRLTAGTCPHGGLVQISFLSFHG